MFFLVIMGCRNITDDGDQIIHYNQPNNITSLDPAFARSMNNIWAVHHLFSKLVKLDEEMNIIGDIAKNWEISNDGLSYVFHLKTHVSFHPNPYWDEKSRTIKAADVVYSFQRIIDKDLASPGSWIFNDRVDPGRPFEALNDSTFVLRLARPFAPMLSILTMEYCGIVPSDLLKVKGNDFARNPVGSGPYRFLRWRENQGLFLTKNQDYSNWNPGLPKNDGVRISFIRDRKTALLELLQGNMDYLSGFDVTYRALILDDSLQLQKRHRGQIKIDKNPFLNTEYLGINLEKAQKEGSPLANVNFRRALNFALNKTLLISSLNGGIGKPAQQGFIPRGLPSFDQNRTGYIYHEDSARKYLVMSNYQNEELILHTNKDYLEKCLFAARSWEDLGIRVKVELVESSMLRDMMRKGEITFFRASWIADYPDGESFLTVFYGKNPAPPNYTRFANEDFDTLYEKSLTTTNDSLKLELYRKADQVIIEQAPVIFMYYDESFALSRMDVKGIQSNALNLLEAEYATKSF